MARIKSRFRARRVGPSLRLVNPSRSRRGAVSVRVHVRGIKTRVREQALVVEARLAARGEYTDVTSRWRFDGYENGW